MSHQELVEQYVKRPYSVVLNALTEADGGGWLAETRELPGCTAVGQTREEALRNLEEARLAWLETAVEEGFVIPDPRLSSEYSGKLTLRIPKSLHALLAGLADDEGVSLNQLICDLISRGAGYEVARREAPRTGDSGITIAWAGGESVTIPESLLIRGEGSKPSAVAGASGVMAKEPSDPHSSYGRRHTRRQRAK